MEEEVNIKFTSKLSFLIGIPIPKPEFFENLSRLSKFLWHLYVILGQILFFVLMISLSIEISISYSDLKVSIMAFVAVIFTTQNILNFILFVTKSGDLSKVFNALELLCEKFSARKDGYANIHRRYYEPVKRLGKIAAICEVASVVVYIPGIVIASLFSDPDSLQLPVRTWTPFDGQRNPGYSAVTVLEGIGFGLALLKNSGNGIIILTVLLSSAAQLEYLKMLLAKIYDDNDTSVDNGKTEAESSWWIKSHQEILQILEDFRPFCSYYLCIAYAAVCTSLFLAGVVVTSPDLDWDVYKKIIFLGNIIIQTFQLYVLCIAADILNDSGLAAARSGLSCKLIFSSNSLRRSFTFATARSSKAVSFTAAGLSPLCSATFGEMFRLTATYFVTIVQIRERYTGPERTGSETLSSLRNN